MSYNGSESSGELRALVIGKAGNGKSSLCNAIVGDNCFKVGRGMSTTTLTAQSETFVKGNMRIKVVDTPDITNSGMDAQQRRKEVSKWRQLTLPQPSVVLLTVKCDGRYTAEEYAIYQEILSLWGNSLKDHLVVAFTFEDCQDTPIEEELPAVCAELKAVLRDAGHNYITFDKTSENSCNGVMNRIIEAIKRRGGSTHNISRLATLLLVGLLLISVVCWISFIVIGPEVAAIGLGVLAGIIFVSLLVLVVCVCGGVADKTRAVMRASLSKQRQTSS